MKKAKNFILFLIVCLCFSCFVYVEKIDFKQKISLEVLDLFPKNQDRKIVDLYRKLGDSRIILVAQERKDEIAKQEFDAFLAQVKTLPNIESIFDEKHSDLIVEDFIRKNYFFVGDFKPIQMDTNAMIEKIKTDILENKLNGFDPLGIINIPTYKNNFEIHGLPYVVVRIKDSNAKAVDELYQRFRVLAEQYKITHYFSPLFMSVENPQLVMQEVNILTMIALVFFVFLYFAILRMPFLTFNSIATILLSNLVAILALLMLYPKVSIMSLSFGIGISNICIDYMMHHHFLGYYTQQKIKFNSSVFYGYMTTLIGFFVCLFVPFPLLNQLALYAIINLSVAYVCFAFLYQTIPFAKPRFFSLVAKMCYPKIPALFFVFLALGVGIYGVMNLKIDLDLSKLDYQNKEMNEQKEFFAPLLEEKTFIIQARSIDALILKAREIAKKDPKSVGVLGLMPTKKDIQIRQRYFKSLAFLQEKKKMKNVIYKLSKENGELAQMLKIAYQSFPRDFNQIDSDTLKALGVDLLKEGNHYYFQGSIENLSLLDGVSGVDTQQLQELIQKITSSVYEPMVSILVLAFIAILVLLLIVARRAFFHSVGFVLLPVASVVLVLALKDTPLNIMHLFAMLLIVVVGVDYGIYHIQEDDGIGARHAILFSTLTTLCSFGLFLFSKTKALSSFGEVVVIGMACILLMIFFQKNYQKHKGDEGNAGV